VLLDQEYNHINSIIAKWRPTKKVHADPHCCGEVHLERCGPFPGDFAASAGLGWQMVVRRDKGTREFPGVCPRVAPAR
jgi:hypothetical protein